MGLHTSNPTYKTYHTPPGDTSLAWKSTVYQWPSTTSRGPSKDSTTPSKKAVIPPLKNTPVSSPKKCWNSPKAATGPSSHTPKSESYRACAAPQLT